MSPYQNCLAHSLQQWEQNKKYNLFYDGDHVFASKAEQVEGCCRVESEKPTHWSTFPLDGDEVLLLCEYYFNKNTT